MDALQSNLLGSLSSYSSSSSSSSAAAAASSSSSSSSSASLFLANTALARVCSSLTPISSAALSRKASSDRLLHSVCIASCGARKALPTKDHHAGTPISLSPSIVSNFISHDGHPLNFDSAENTCPSSSSRAEIQKKTLIVMRNNAAAGYAAALAEIGQSKRILNLIYTDLNKLGTFLQNKQLRSFLLHPSIQDTYKKDILVRLANDHAFIPYTLKLLNLIVDKKGAYLLTDVVKEFEAIYNKIKNTEVVIVLSAMEMDTAQLAHIARRIQAMTGLKNVSMKNVIDASVVAGYVIKYGKDGSKLIDMSMKA